MSASVSAAPDCPVALSVGPTDRAQMIELLEGMAIVLAHEADHCDPDIEVDLIYLTADVLEVLERIG